MTEVSMAMPLKPVQVSY